MYRWAMFSLVLLLKPPGMFAQPAQKSLAAGPESTLDGAPDDGFQKRLAATGQQSLGAHGINSSDGKK